MAFCVWLFCDTVSQQYRQTNQQKKNPNAYTEMAGDGLAIVCHITKHINF